MYKIGMFGGTFNPLHLGHINNIIIAANQCEKLYVVLSVTKDKKEIDYKERLKWLKNITEDMENVDVFGIFDNCLSKDSTDWKQGAIDVKKYIGRNIDAVFVGDDYKGKNIWEKLYRESKIIYLPRSEINISSTKIRKNVYKYFEFLPNCVKQFYTKKVCIIGTESCGKSTLVKNLAKYFNTSYVEEVGRNICIEAGGIDNMQPYHYYKILFNHKKKEYDALKTSNKVLFIDTDALITLFYYQLAFEETTGVFCDIAKGISALNNYDLYIFLEPDVKWVQDETRISGDDEIRNSNNEKLKELLHENNISYISINGDYQNRFNKSKELVKKLLFAKQK